ncbi:MAG TPA: VOC family protein [Longimicrobiales bacterium]|nr:VOC family protein [Longimicrobiales bacterium]
MQITPYINFQGKCREAMEFYRDLLGGEIVQIFTYGESPMAGEMPAESHDGIMHSHLVARGAELMGADGPPAAGQGANNVSIALNLDDVDEAERVFAALVEGGAVGMEFQKTFWAERFGMCVDRYGTGWLVNAGLMEQPAGDRERKAVEERR